MAHYWIWQISLLMMWSTSKAQVEFAFLDKQQCIEYDGETVLTCNLATGTINKLLVSWKGPDNTDIVFAGTSLVENKYTAESQTGAVNFSITINRTQDSDLGLYTCAHGSSSADFNFTKENIEYITCNADGDTKKMVIAVEYNNKKDKNPDAVVDYLDGQTVPCVDESTSAGEPTAGTCTFNNIAAGTYSYTVNNYGECNLMCTGQVTVTGSSTSSPTTKISTTVTPDLTTTGPATTSDKVASASTTTATTSSNSLKIVYGVCGSLGGIIVFVFIAILIYKTKKRNAGNRYTQSNLQHINRRKDRSSNRYDNRGFADSSQDHRYKTQEPYNSHVSNQSARMSPDYEQQDRDDHKYQGMSGKYAPYSTGGSHTDDPLDVTYYTGESQRY